MEVKCPECKEMFDLDLNEFDEGDVVECPECGSESKVKVSGGKFKLASHREELHDFDEIEYEEA